MAVAFVTRELKRWNDSGDVSSYYPENYNPNKIHTDDNGNIYMAGFDLDGTLMTSSVGRTFTDEPRDPLDEYLNTPRVPSESISDRCLNTPRVPSESINRCSKDTYIWQQTSPNEYKILQKLSDDGWGVVIFSNQSDSRITNKVKKRVLEFFYESKFSCPVYLSLKRSKDNMFRKPNIGMINMYLSWIQTSRKQTNMPQCAKGSFYCGDGSGIKSTFPWYQWDDVDRKFAQNANIVYYEPDQILGKYKFPSISDDINLIITCGQYGSGWEYCVDAKSDRKLIILDTGTVLKKLDKSIKIEADELYLVYGLNPTKAIRDQIRSKFILFPDKGNLNSLVMYFGMRSKYSKTDLPIARQYEFSKFFAMDGRTNTNENWVRVN